jgi:hypothetical protein
MDRNKSVDLIKSYVLGCLNPEVEKGLKSFMEDTENFPWQELGQYQNLVAMLPLNLSLETPGAEVKANISRKISELRVEPESLQQVEEVVISDQILLDDDQQAVIYESPQETLEEITLSELSEEVSENTEILIEEDILAKGPVTPLKRKTEKIEKGMSKTAEEHKRGSKMRDVLDKEEFEKMIKEYIDAYYLKMFEDMREESKKTFYIAIAGAALAFIAFIIALIF